MAFIHTNFFSAVLGFNTDLNVFVPTPNSDEILNHKALGYFHKGSRFQVLYLLHGAYGDYTDWMRLTSIEKYAQNHKLAVIMPSASNSFYQDMCFGSNYLTYLTEELTTFVKATFPVSRKRENTFTAGLSMGGYGALKLALTKPEQYSCSASLSGALDIAALFADDAPAGRERPFLPESLFKHPEQIEGSDADLFALIRKLQSRKEALPRIFQSCGTEDFIYPINQSAKRKLEALGVDLTYEEHRGIHDWDYWDTNIQRVLDWLPLVNDAVNE
ncbi:alpha/beta hydrolase [Caproicibacter sp.]|uniref:alpha/beta hydrolase n=1 Tax=Caproicibacter sp. TaxID=2814884 RepID=UPI00398A034F